MTFLASLAIVFQATTALAGPAAPASDVPHPAVARVIAPDAEGVAYGSGTLVGVNGRQGLVVTNWHVVRDATGQIEVVFPDGFRSAATVLATDADWDLAALAIWRPAVEPVPLAGVAPRPGEVLTIAGYGSGRYRAVAGRCTQYVAPGKNLPFEMVELSVAARQGDSGGPILNGRGELAGVLFGAARGTTTGSYCGRVKWFLARVSDQFRDVPDLSTSPDMLASEPPAGRIRDARTAYPRPEPARQPIAARWPDHDPRSPAGWDAAPAEPIVRPPDGYSVTASIPAPYRPASTAGDASQGGYVSDGWVASMPAATPSPPPGNAAPELPGSALEASAGPTRLDQIKTALAVIGCLAILFHGLRLFGAMKEL